MARCSGQVSPVKGPWRLKFRIGAGGGGGGGWWKRWKVGGVELTDA